MIKPSESFPEVLALNALQKSMMLTPCCPRAGPTGGAGVALPAGICSLTCPITFFAIKSLAFVSASMTADDLSVRLPAVTDRRYSCLRLLYLQKIKFNRCRSAKDGHHDL